MSDPIVRFCDVCGSGLPEHTCCSDHPHASTTPTVLPIRYRWIIEIELAPDLVADGANLDDPRQLERLLERAYPNAPTTMTSACVLSSPDPDQVAREQGYKSLAHRMVSRGRG